VRVIDTFGNITCSINLLSTSGKISKSWNFGYDFKQARADELEKVIRIVKMIENRKRQQKNETK